MSLVRRSLRALLLDVGNTIAFLDMRAVEEVVRSEGYVVDAAVLRTVEGRAKRLYEERLREGASHEEGWGLYLAALLEAAGLASHDARAMIAPLRASHDRLNLWRRVPDELPAALERARGAGLRLAIVSNSEGRLPALLEHVGLAHLFETIVDSHLEGVRKPDPEIFRRALDRMRIAAHETIYLGDIPGVDVEGANAAGIDAVLVDPFGFYERFEGERVTSAAAWIDAYLGG